MNRFRFASHVSYRIFSSGSVSIITFFGTRLSASPRGTGTSMQNGSPFSNRTHSNGRVSFQFMVNVDDAQSVSITPSSGWTPSLSQLAGPLAHRLMPGGGRNRYGTEKVTTALPKWLEM